MALPSSNHAGLISRVMLSSSDPAQFLITDFVREAPIEQQPPSRTILAKITGYACTTAETAVPITSTSLIPATHIQVVNVDGKPYSIGHYSDSRQESILTSIPSKWTLQVQWLNPANPVIFLNPVTVTVSRMFRQIHVPYPIHEHPQAGYSVTFSRLNQVIGDTEVAGPVYAQQSFFKDWTQAGSEVPHLRSSIGTSEIFLNMCGQHLPLSSLVTSKQFEVISALQAQHLRIRTTGPRNTLVFDDRPPSIRSTLL